jgi:hypothetical protein
MRRQDSLDKVAGRCFGSAGLSIPSKFRDMKTVPYMASERSLERVSCCTYALFVLAASLALASVVSHPPMEVKIVQSPADYKLSFLSTLAGTTPNCTSIGSFSGAVGIPPTCKAVKDVDVGDQSIVDCGPTVMPSEVFLGVDSGDPNQVVDGRFTPSNQLFLQLKWENAYFDNYQQCIDFINGTDGVAEQVIKTTIKPNTTHDNPPCTHSNPCTNWINPCTSCNQPKCTTYCPSIAMRSAGSLADINLTLYVHPCQYCGASQSVYLDREIILNPAQLNVTRLSKACNRLQSSSAFCTASDWNGHRAFSSYTNDPGQGFPHHLQLPKGMPGHMQATLQLAEVALDVSTATEYITTQESVITRMPYWFFSEDETPALMQGQPTGKAESSSAYEMTYPPPYWYSGTGDSDFQRMSSFWSTPNGNKLMATAKKQFDLSAPTFCAPFAEEDESGAAIAPLPPYACTEKAYSNAIGSALGYVNTTFALLMLLAPLLVSWLLTMGPMFPFYVEEPQNLNENELSYLEPPIADRLSGADTTTRKARKGGQDAKREALLPSGSGLN